VIVGAQQKLDGVGVLAGVFVGVLVCVGVGVGEGHIPELHEPLDMIVLLLESTISLKQ
jgi:hypothetical protein